MDCLLEGHCGIWLFPAPDKKEGRKRAEQILSVEAITAIAANEISGFGRYGVWKATRVFLCQKDTPGAIKVELKGEIITIKRLRHKLDVLYVTRRQTEREKPS